MSPDESAPQTGLGDRLESLTSSFDFDGSRSASLSFRQCEARIDGTMIGERVDRLALIIDDDLVRSRQVNALLLADEVIVSTFMLPVDVL